MRPSQSLIIIGAALFGCGLGPLVRAQTAATQPAAAPVHPHEAAHPSRHPHSGHASHSGDAARAGAPAAPADGVLSLGATDITGNKELPKVMVIVPWKDSLAAGGVVKPSDSLMDEVLTPVDRSVFQRRIRYYGQLNTGGQPAAGKVAPVGDSH